MSNTIMLSGHAKLPKGMAARDLYETLTITTELDNTYGVIIEASCTLATHHAQLFINEKLKGYSVKDGIDSILHVIDISYHGKAKEALIAAFKDMYQHYLLLE